MQKASEVAWEVINEHRELFDSISKGFAVEIISTAIRKQIKEALSEAQARAELVDCAGLSSYEISSRIVTAIRKLSEEIEGKLTRENKNG